MDYVTSLKICSEEVRAAIKRLEEIVVRFERRKYSCGNALDLLRNNLEKPGERISVKRSNMHGAMNALEGSIS